MESNPILSAITESTTSYGSQLEEAHVEGQIVDGQAGLETQLTGQPQPAQAGALPLFPAYPAAQRYVELGSVADTITRLTRAIATQEAISLVIGPPGLGKSLVCQLIADAHRSSHRVVILNQTPLIDESSLIRHLLHQVGSDYRQLPESELHLSLLDYINCQCPDGGLLVIVDEAQSLPVATLEALRMVTNISDGRQRKITAVVAGGPKLEDQLVLPVMESFVQRVATRCYLHPMNHEETSQYVQSTIERCGSEINKEMDQSAISAVQHATAGVPRLVNQLMTQSIDVATARGESRITEHVVSIAWAELQQLPSPIVDEPKLAEYDSSIEFGSLQASDSDATVAKDEAQACVTDAETCSDTTFAIVDELPDVSPPPSAPTAEELFGNFNEEESIEVAEIALRPTTSPAGHSSSIESVTSEPAVIETPAGNFLPTESLVADTFGNTLDDTNGGDAVSEASLYSEDLPFSPMPLESEASMPVASEELMPVASEESSNSLGSAEYVDHLADFIEASAPACEVLPTELCSNDLADESLSDPGIAEIQSESLSMESEIHSEVIGLANTLGTITHVDQEIPVELPPTQLTGESDALQRGDAAQQTASPTNFLNIPAEDVIEEDLSNEVVFFEDVIVNDAGAHWQEEETASAPEEEAPLRLANESLASEADQENTLNDLVVDDESANLSLAASEPLQSDVTDDSDMLVVEDEIELRVESPEETEDAREQGRPIPIDFQAMMARMRSESA